MIALLGAAAPVAHAQDPPPQDPGVTQRVFQLGGAPSEICVIKPGQTPNVDELKPTIDWEGDAAFGGLTQNFVVHAIATLTVPTAGTYTFRLRSDDGSGAVHRQHARDRPRRAARRRRTRTATIQLTAGRHELRVNFFEAGGGQELRLSWRKPGDSGFAIVPTSALSADRAVRVTAPGTKECEGDVDTPGDGLPLDGLNPGYDLVNLRPAGFEPKVTGLEWIR